ncbi:hypothetical protein N566_24845 [Streptomycetaceae bacterium MP113-05]|nr:hypothetical protein N566_24845 [Streptomycetaceae bacterium MP113-05]
MSEANEHGPAERRTGIPRDLPDQEAAARREEAEEHAADQDQTLPGTDEPGSGPRRAGARVAGEGYGDRKPPEPAEPTD